MFSSRFTVFPSDSTHTVSTDDWDAVMRTVKPIVRNPASQQNMIDELNRRLIDMETRISSYASKVQTVEASNVALTEMVEYLKAVANGDI